MLRVELEAAGPLRLALALEAAPGRCVALAGPSGGGKTTTLRAVAGLVRARGRVACAGETWLDSAAGVDLAPERRRVGMAFQDHALFGHLSAWRNVAYGMDDVPRRDRRAAALALLARLGLEARADARPAELSGGERQRVALARALARRPRALLLDEPLSSLDARTRAEAAVQLARVLRETGVPAVLVTHDFAEAAQLADRVAVLDGGRVVQSGAPAELAATPRSGFVADFTGAVVLHGTARGGDVTLDGGGTLTTTGDAQGAVAVIVHPWDIALHEPGAVTGSARNRVAARVAGVTVLGNRARVALDAAQPLVAEVTPQAVEHLALAPGRPVVAVWKAAATRVVPR